MRNITYLLLFLISINIFAEEKAPKIPVKFSVNLFPHQETHILALSYQNAPHWHTYWKNPGDAGLETKYEFSIAGEKIAIAEYGWPAPQKFIEQGNLLAYGYVDDYSLFFAPSKEQVQSWEGKEFKISSKWLVCKNICIPGQAEVSGKISEGKFQKSAHQDFEVSAKELVTRYEEIPRPTSFPANLDIVMKKNPNKDELILYYNYLPSAVAQIDSSHKSLLTPFPLSPFDFTREELKQDSQGQFYGKFPIAWDGEYSDPVVPFPKDGNFTQAYTLKFLFLDPVTKKSSVIEKEFTRFDLDNSQAESFFQSIKNNTNSSQSSSKSSQTSASTPSLFYYLVMAFFGGLILNVMPCVLPVISLKLFGLIKYQDHSRSDILKHNLFYTLGVLITFMLLAVIVLILKASGETVGWGFQLQSPHFVAVMAIVLFVFALNMFGLFEFRVPGAEKFAALSGKEGPLGHIFEGILATILSTPCSAPFLGTALTFAFTSGTIGIIGMFFVIGLGLAFPFIFTAIFPNSIKFLPKPGSWMNKLKIFLAFTLILTMVWLIDIFNVLVDSSSAMIELLTILTLFFFAIYFSNKFSKSFKQILLSLLIPIAATIHLMTLPLESKGSVEGNVSLLKDKQSHGIPWERWSEEKMKQYQSAGEQVFIDFTAKWCFTCKVNERLVIDTQDFKELIEQTNTKPLLADWTKRDEKIGKWLESQGLVGVPAYFIIDRSGKLISLGETLTLDEVKKYLKKP